MTLPDTLRNLFRIRKERRILPAGPKPPVGSSIVKDGLRMRLNFPINNQQWSWLSDMGWRATDMRTDRRKYTLVSDSFVNRLLDADDELRHQLHLRLVASQQAAS